MGACTKDGGSCNVGGYPPRGGPYYIHSIVPADRVWGEFIYGIEFDETNRYIKIEGLGLEEYTTYNVDRLVLDVHNSGNTISPSSIEDSRTIYFKNFVNALGDNSCKICYYPFAPLMNAIVLNEPPAAINITCDKAYNSSLPAGASLNSICRIYYENAYLVISIGYRQPVGDNLYKIDTAPNSLGFPYAVVGEDLEDVDLAALRTMGTNWFFRFKEAPENTDTYQFTVTVLQQDGSTLTLQSEPVSIEGSV